MGKPDNLDPDNLDYPCPKCGAEAGHPCTYVWPEHMKHRSHLVPTSLTGWQVKARVGRLMVTPHNERHVPWGTSLVQSMSSKQGEWGRFLTIFEETHAEST